MRAFLITIPIVLIVMSMSACQGSAGPAGEQGPPGPVGPAGPTGEAATLGKDELQPVPQQLESDFQADLINVRAADSERLDNTIHGLIEATRNPAFKERLSRLDSEIHRVFNAVEAASSDPETKQTLELMQGIVVLSSVMNAIAEARITADGQASGQQSMQGQTEASVPPKWMPEAYTNYFVREAIRRYESDGLDSTVAHYNTDESVDGQWYVFMIDEDGTLIAHANPALVGQLASDVLGPNNYPTGAAVAATADQDGAWFDYTFPNLATGTVETKHSWMVIHDGITFGSGWYEEGPRKTDAPAYTETVVQQAINLYDAVGLEDTVAYYNTEESVDGQWYVFMMDEDGTVIAHANPALVGQLASDVLGPNNYPTGAAVAASADENGAWFDYTFTNLATGTVETKHSWMVIHDGITFGSGWYEEGPRKTDSPVYTQAFVQQAINLYEAVGFAETVQYYNTEESVDGQWYVFMMDEDGTVIAHANPALVGQLASDVLGPNNYPTGAAVAASADENGAWFDYTFTNLATGTVETKHSWMVIHDGITFGSGWYEEGPRKTDAPAYTEAVVQQAINLYEAVGLEDTVAYYNTTESVDGQWYAFIIGGESDFTIAHHNPVLRGRDPSLRVDPTGYFYGDDLLGATEAGRWVEYVIVNPETGENQRKHTFAVLHDGYIFASGWYEQ